MSSSVTAAAVVRRAFVVHGVALVVGLMAIGLVVQRVGDADGTFFAGLVLGWLLGVPLSLVRLRPWAFFVGGLVVGWIVVAANVAAAETSSTVAFERLGVVWVGVQFGAASSFALLAPRLDIAALWLPLGLHVAAAVTWLNEHDAVSMWRSDKLAVWDAPSAGLVALGVVFFVVTLAARQRVSRVRWQSAGASVDDAGVAVVDRSRVWLLGILLAVVVLTVAPFLLRTRPGCGECTTTATTETTTTTPPPPPPPLDADHLWSTWQKLWRTLGDIGEAAVVLGAVVVVVGGVSLPLLRRRRLRALAEPAASLPPTERVRRRFRRAVVALHECGVVVDGALVAPRGLLASVADVEDADEADGPGALVDAVALWEQVCFGGRGLPDDVEARMAQAMGEIVKWSQARRSAWQALSSSFRVPSL